MNHLTLLPAAVLLAGCAAGPGQDEENPRDVVKDPARIHGFFLQMIRERKETIATQVTTLPEGHLYFGVRNQIAPDLTRRILLGFEQHSIEVVEEGRLAIVTWCNREFGIFRKFRLVRTPQHPVWRLEITREQIEELATAGLAWFKRQRDAADGRIYAYPPDWVATNVSASCGCGR